MMLIIKITGDVYKIYVRKITSIVPIGNQIIIDTVQATLEEAIENCHIKIQQTLSPGDVVSVFLMDGVTFTHHSPFELTLDNLVLYHQKDKFVNGKNHINGIEGFGRRIGDRSYFQFKGISPVPFLFFPKRSWHPQS